MIDILYLMLIEKAKNIIVIMINLFKKENIQMVKEMVKEKNMILIVI